MREISLGHFMKNLQGKNTKNSIRDVLIGLALSTPGSIKKFHPCVRDRRDVSVLRCEKSGVILLSRTDHMDMSHYTAKEKFEYVPKSFVKGRGKIKKISYRDDIRRTEQFRGVIAGKRWLDVGTGAGGILDLLSPYAAATFAVEPQDTLRRELQSDGYAVFPRIEEVGEKIEVVTLFHVFEHLLDPLGTLVKIKKILTDGGKILLEVPHANDFLISHLDLKAFKDFTFWSEHLILHTRESLRVFLRHAGFKNICISGYQRFPLANHLYWIKEEKPGGHVRWNFLSNKEVDSAYANLLGKIDATDTLIAIAEK